MALKQQEVQNALKEFELNFKVEKTVGMFFPFKYRNKVQTATKLLMLKSVCFTILGLKN